MRKAHWVSILILTAAAGPCLSADLGKASGEDAMSGDIEQTAAADRFKPTHAYAWKETRGAKQQTVIFLFNRDAPVEQWTDAKNRESAIAAWTVDNKATVVSLTLADQGKTESVQP